MAAETIPFDKALAKELRGDTEDMMSAFDGESNCSGRDMYACRFCFHYTYAGESKGIEHDSNCLGTRLMAELDKKLADGVQKCSNCGANMVHVCGGDNG
jgi:hypothetical protein